MGYLRRWLANRRWKVFAGVYAGLFSMLVGFVGLDIYYGIPSPNSWFDWGLIAAFLAATVVIGYRTSVAFRRGWQAGRDD